LKKTLLTLAVLAAFLISTSAFSFAEEAAAKKQSGLSKTGSVMGRGAVNLVTFPGEVVRTFSAEKETHPKAWPLSYTPKLLLNMGVRLVSSVNDMLIFPFYAWNTDDARPITNFYDLPDYVWQQL